MVVTTIFLDSSEEYYIMKLMIVQNLRITDEMKAEIMKLSKELGENQRTIIRLAIREGLEVVRRKFQKTKEAK